MGKSALFIRHRALPGKRDEFQRVWEKHLKARVAANPAHEAYFYCYDDNDPDTICVFQQYVDRASSQEYVGSPWYAAYVNKVSPLLAGTIRDPYRHLGLGQGRRRLATPRAKQFGQADENCHWSLVTWLKRQVILLAGIG